eukprot:SAG11_NODE_408_length_9704_cov_6.496774_7_plen_173_part_00
MAMRNRTLSFVRLGRIGSPLNGFSATRAPSRLFSIPSNSASRGPRLDDGAHGEVENRHVLAALVQNEQGVLARVATLFAGRGFNIDSLVVGRTEVPELSRMTIVVNCDALQLSQVRSCYAQLYAAPTPLIVRLRWSRCALPHQLSCSFTRVDMNCAEVQVQIHTESMAPFWL